MRGKGEEETCNEGLKTYHLRFKTCYNQNYPRQSKVCAPPEARLLDTSVHSNRAGIRHNSKEASPTSQTEGRKRHAYLTFTLHAGSNQIKDLHSTPLCILAKAFRRPSHQMHIVSPFSVMFLWKGSVPMAWSVF